MNRTSAFWDRVERGPGCWEWRLRRETTGYCHFVFGRERRYAHRVAWELAFGDIPPGLFVCHRCDNRACVRPDHLFLGTAQENTVDMYAKGRGNPPRGVKNGQAKLDESDVQAIRDATESCRVVGMRFGVSPTQVNRIRNNKRWRSLPPRKESNDLPQVSGSVG